MPIYEKNEIDARPLTEIWQAMTPQQKEDLRLRLLITKAAKSRQAIYFWAVGKRQPKCDIVKDTIAREVSKIIQHKVLGRTLFPLK